AWWVRLLARVPWGVGYGFATVLGWLAFRVFPYRERLVRGNLTRAFPHFDEPELRAVMRGYYLGFAQMLVEIIKGASLPGEEIRPDIIKRRDVVRAVAMVADQEPTTSEHKYWTRFLNRDTAFYLGPEEIARVTRFPVFFISMRRTGRGYYEMRIEPLAEAGEVLSSGAL